MQPRLTDDSQSTYPNSTPTDTAISRQYGFPLTTDRGPQLPRDETSDGDGLSQEAQQQSSDPSLPAPPSPFEGLSEQLSPEAQSSPTESLGYEGVQPSLIEGHDAIDSRLDSRVRASKARGPRLTDIPNEVLTHIFSHLSPSALSTVSLVSRHFRDLVTTPHAWRTAFCRYFPASESASLATRLTSVGLEPGRRVFTRLTALASWRSEYIVRTRLLRSLARGRPAQLPLQSGTGSSRSGGQTAGSAQVTYNSNLLGPINHLEASFGGGLNKKLPRFIHGSDDLGVVSSSDPSNAKSDTWGSGDPQSFFQFADRFPGDAQYGLGTGEVVGVPNPMDVSQPFGMIIGVGAPGGLVYHRSTGEQRGRFLAGSLEESIPELGIPQLNPAREAVCSVWIAKSQVVPSITEGLIGMLSGSSYGILTSYSLGTNDTLGRRLERGEITGRWVLSPGVPIISIAVDEEYSAKRCGKKRIWAVILNALGEAFCLSAIPRRAPIASNEKLSNAQFDQLAWETGRSVFWTLVEPTRRIATPDPYHLSDVDGSYTPRSSWLGMGLSSEQIAAETKEIDRFIREPPKHFQRTCEGWDMRRRLEVDFAADDENGAGEAIFVIECGLDERPASIKRVSRHLIDEADLLPSPLIRSLKSPQDDQLATELGQSKPNPSWSFSHAYNDTIKSPSLISDGEADYFESWKTTEFLFGNLKSVVITTTAIDKSTYALLTVSEDPLLSSGASDASSSWSSPSTSMPLPGQQSEIPGQRSRFIAAGTKAGTVLIWNMRTPTSGSARLTNSTRPVRVIHTDSPQISCLALSSLYLVHGGNDGLVQAWDPLASTEQPIRTINSRFSSRARRRIAQAEASLWGVGLNLFAAGAICLDPDPKSLRGMVSLGAHLRYWSISSTEAESYKSSKRRLRRTGRGSNQGGEKFHNTGRGALKDYILHEKIELERDKEERRRESERLVGRFGVGLLGPEATEDEIMAYATMLSEESAQLEQARHTSQSPSGETVVESVGPSSPLPAPSSVVEYEDPAIAEAIRLSLEHTEESHTLPGAGPSFEFPVRYVRPRKNPQISPLVVAESSNSAELDDLEFALQLSLVEERSKMHTDHESFPNLPEVSGPSSGASRGGKGKEKEQF